MAASDHLGLQFKHIGYPLGDDPDEHSLYAVHPEAGRVGELHWYGSRGGQKWGNTYRPGEVNEVVVHPEFRRQGVGTSLWNEAQKYDPAPVHSTDRTKVGDAWARKVGGDLPEREVR